MVGDKSDNIPGVYGVGDKGATKLLLEWGNLDAIYENLDDVMPTRARNALAEHRDDAYLSRALGTIVDVPGIELDLDACVVHDYDRQAVLRIFSELDFRTMASRLPAQDTVPASGEQLGLFGDPQDEVADICSAQRLSRHHDAGSIGGGVRTPGCGRTHQL